MFKDVISRDNGCPWGRLDMNTAAWREVAPRVVNIADLIATQPGVLLAGLQPDEVQSARYSRTGDLTRSTDPIPHVIEWRGDRYLEDGHHRVVRAALNGETYITARLLRLDDRQGF